MRSMETAVFLFLHVLAEIMTMVDASAWRVRLLERTRTGTLQRFNICIECGV